MRTMNEMLRQELLAMEAEDLRVRAELLDEGALGDGYNPRMRAVHERNAARLKEIIAAHGWPGRSLVGPDGSHAAWRIVQHAIGDPPFQRQALELLRLRDRQGFSVVALGDDKQCESIEAGAIIELSRRALGAEQVPQILTTVRQQRA